MSFSGSFPNQIKWEFRSIAFSIHQEGFEEGGINMKFFFMMLGLLCLLSIPTKAWPNVRLLRKEIRKPILKDEDRMVFPGKPSFHEVNLKMADQILLFAKMVS